MPPLPRAHPMFAICLAAAILAPAAPPAAAEPPPATLRILSYNIHHGEGTDGKIDLERIAGVILSVNPDLVALQEVDKGVMRTHNVDQPAEFARLTGMQVIFEKNIPYQGGEYGNAVLSRIPADSHVNHAIPSLTLHEQRGALDVRFTTAAGPLRFLATHLDSHPPDDERRLAVALFDKLAGDEPQTPLVLAGDLNSQFDSEVMHRLRKSWKPTNDEIMPTFPVTEPARQIDFILVRPAARFRILETRVLDEAVASDHRGILAVIELLPAPVPRSD